MAKRRPTEDEVARYAFFLAIDGLCTPPPGALPRLYPSDRWTRAEIFKCLRHEYGARVAKWAETMKLFTEH